MDESAARPALWSVGASLALLVLALGCLVAGRFVQLDDVTGFGSERWVMPYAWLALLAGAASLLLALIEPRARPPLGWAVAGVVVLLTWQSMTNEGFRFIWSAGDGELLLLTVTLGLAALALLATGPGSTSDAADGPAGPRWPLRAVGYLALAFVALLLAFTAGTAHSEAVDCGADASDCDLSMLEGVVWAGAALLLWLVAVPVNELRLLVRRRARRRADRSR